MRHLQSVLLATVAIIGLASIASAADLPVKAPQMVAPVAPSWTGWYIGINGGGVWGRAHTGFTAANNAAPYLSAAQIAQVQAVGSNSIANSGGLAGGQIGYLMQGGSFIFGIEAAFDWMRATGGVASTNTYAGLAPGNNFTISESVSTNWLATFLGRVGPNMGSLYPYVTGGLAVAKLNYTNTYTDTPFGANTTTSLSSVKAAPAVGGGVEYRWNGPWSIRGEYLYTKFNNVTGTGVIGNAFGSFTATHSVNFVEQIGRVALSYKF